MAGVEQITVEAGEAGMRLDRWFKTHFPGLGFGHLQKLLRSGQIRVDGGRVKADTRVEPGQMVRVPPLEVDKKGESPLTGHSIRNQGDADVLAKMLIHEDPKVFVFNKPAGLAVQGGSGVTRNVDDMLEAWRSQKGEKPRLVHRLDRDTSGVLVVARTRLAAMKLSESFRARETKKTYWALVKGVPKPPQGKVEAALVKAAGPDGDRVRKALPGEQAKAMHATTHYSVIDRVAHKAAWVSLKPVTGRQHQLRAHMALIGNPIVGDNKYDGDKVLADSGIEAKLHLHARRIVIPHPAGAANIDVTAPLPEHMRRTWELLGLDARRFDADRE